MKSRTQPGGRLARWSHTVATQAARAARYVAEKSEAVELAIEVYLPRPPTVKRALPTVPPDGDKCARAIADALQRVAYDNDSQVTDWHIRQRYADSTDPGVLVGAKLLDEQTTQMPLFDAAKEEESK